MSLASATTPSRAAARTTRTRAALGRATRSARPRSTARDVAVRHLHDRVVSVDVAADEVHAAADDFGHRPGGSDLSTSNGTWGGSSATYPVQLAALRSQQQLRLDGVVAELSFRALTSADTLEVAVTATNSAGFATETSSSDGDGTSRDVAADEVHAAADDFGYGSGGSDSVYEQWDVGWIVSHLHLQLAALRSEQQLQLDWRCLAELPRFEC